MLHFLFPRNSNTQFGLKDLGLIFLKIEDTKLFYSKSPLAYIGFCTVVQFLKSYRKFLFLDHINSSLTAPWISAASANWAPFKFSFNLGNRKQSGSDKSGEYGGVKGL